MKTYTHPNLVAIEAGGVCQNEKRCEAVVEQEKDVKCLLTAASFTRETSNTTQHSTGASCWSLELRHK